MAPDFTTGGGAGGGSEPEEDPGEDPESGGSGSGQEGGGAEGKPEPELPGEPEQGTGGETGGETGGGTTGGTTGGTETGPSGPADVTVGGGAGADGTPPASSQTGGAPDATQQDTGGQSTTPGAQTGTAPGTQPGGGAPDAAPDAPRDTDTRQGDTATVADTDDDSPDLSDTEGALGAGFSGAVNDIEEQTGVNLTPGDYEISGNAVSLTLAGRKKVAAEQLESQVQYDVDITTGDVALDVGEGLTLSRQGQRRVNAAKLSKRLDANISPSEVFRTESGKYGVKPAALPAGYVAAKASDQLGTNVDAGDVQFENGRWQLTPTARLEVGDTSQPPAERIAAGLEQATDLEVSPSNISVDREFTPGFEGGVVNPAQLRQVASGDAQPVDAQVELSEDLQAAVAAAQPSLNFGANRAPIETGTPTETRLAAGRGAFGGNRDGTAETQQAQRRGALGRRDIVTADTKQAAGRRAFGGVSAGLRQRIEASLEEQTGTELTPGKDFIITGSPADPTVTYTESGRHKLTAVDVSDVPDAAVRRVANVATGLASAPGSSLGGAAPLVRAASKPFADAAVSVSNVTASEQAEIFGAVADTRGLFSDADERTLRDIQSAYSKRVVDPLADFGASQVGLITPQMTDEKAALLNAVPTIDVPESSVTDVTRTERGAKNVFTGALEVTNPGSAALGVDTASEVALSAPTLVRNPRAATAAGLVVAGRATNKIKETARERPGQVVGSLAGELLLAKGIGLAGKAGFVRLRGRLATRGLNYRSSVDITDIERPDVRAEGGLTRLSERAAPEGSLSIPTERLPVEAARRPTAEVRRLADEFSTPELDDALNVGPDEFTVFSARSGLKGDTFVPRSRRPYDPDAGFFSPSVARNFLDVEPSGTGLTGFRLPRPAAAAKSLYRAGRQQDTPTIVATAGRIDPLPEGVSSLEDITGFLGRESGSGRVFVPEGEQQTVTGESEVLTAAEGAESTEPMTFRGTFYDPEDIPGSGELTPEQATRFLRAGDPLVTEIEGERVPIQLFRQEGDVDAPVRSTTTGRIRQFLADTRGEFGTRGVARRSDSDRDIDSDADREFEYRPGGERGTPFIPATGIGEISTVTDSDQPISSRIRASERDRAASPPASVASRMSGSEATGSAPSAPDSGATSPSLSPSGASPSTSSVGSPFTSPSVSGPSLGSPTGSGTVSEPVFNVGSPVTTFNATTSTPVGQAESPDLELEHKRDRRERTDAFEEKTFLSPIADPGEVATGDVFEPAGTDDSGGLTL